MNFNSNKAIYEQMAERLCDEIIAENYKADDRIPSVREYAIMLEVNTNTAVKAYELLAREEIIYNKRGLVSFVSPNARTQILAQRKDEVVNEMLPEVFRQMALLEIDIKDIEKMWNETHTS